MVHAAIWLRAGMPRRGFLCLTCLDDRLAARGHDRVQIADFTDAPCNAALRFGYGLARLENEPPSPRPSREDTIESLETQYVEAQRAFDDTQQTLDRQRVILDERRIALAYKRGTCLCAEGRHTSCQGRRPWCTVNDCACDTCLA